MGDKQKKTSRKLRRSVKTSRHSAALSPEAKEAIENAKKCWRELRLLQTSALRKAQELGGWLHKARGSFSGPFRWLLKKEIKEFGVESVANAYNYIKIFENWSAIEPLLSDYPDLSIDAALRFIKTGSIKKLGTRVAPEKLIAEMLEEVLEDWTAEEKDWFSRSYSEVVRHIRYEDILKRAFRKVRAEVQFAMKLEEP